MQEIGRYSARTVLDARAVAAALLMLTLRTHAQGIEAAIQQHMDKFALVPSATDTATNRLHAITLNEHPLVVDGERIDGFRFVIPSSDHRELQVGVDIPDNAADRMEITPARGHIRHEFAGYSAERVWTRAAAAQTCPTGTRMVFFSVDERDLPPGGETCAIWFVFRDDKPVRVPASVLFTRKDARLQAVEQLPAGMLTDRQPLTPGMRFPQLVILPPTNSAGTEDHAFEQRVVQALAGVLATNNHMLLGDERREWLAEHHLATAADFRFERVSLKAGLAVPTISFKPYSHSGTSNSLAFQVYSSTSKGASNISEMRPVPDLISNKLRDLMPLINGLVDDMLAVPPPLAERAAAAGAKIKDSNLPAVTVTLKGGGGAAAAQQAMETFLKEVGLRVVARTQASPADLVVIEGAAEARPFLTSDGMYASIGRIALRMRKGGQETVWRQSAIVAEKAPGAADQAALVEAALQLAERLTGTLGR